MFGGPKHKNLPYIKITKSLIKSHTILLVVRKPYRYETHTLSIYLHIDSPHAFSGEYKKIEITYYKNYFLIGLMKCFIEFAVFCCCKLYS
jgi:hypothetical protein